MNQYDHTIISENGVACNVVFYKHLWLDVVNSPNDNEVNVITTRLTSIQARELATMLTQAADIAEGK